MKTSLNNIVLYSDERWLAVDKIYGIPTHGGDAGEVGVQEWLSLHLQTETFVCSRLDKGTTGVLLFARSAAASGEAERIHINEQSEKVYYFLSDKDVRKAKGEQWICEQPLDDKPARTKFFFDVALSPQVFRYRAVISRGRMHQIRRHAAMSGCPLWGDSDYGGRGAARVALHCAELRWPGIPLVLRSTLPAIFEAETHSAGPTVLECFAALDKRGAWLSGITDAWRVIQRGELSSLDMSMDLYGQHALVWLYDDTEFGKLSSQLAFFLTHLKQRFGVQGIVYRRIAKNPHKRGLVQDVFVEGIPPADEFIVNEHDWQASVTLTTRQHVGLFLDHRDNRRRVQQSAKGQRVANLFSYTCAFGIASARAGCEVVMNVDASASTLAIGKKNFELNQLSETRSGKFIEKDVRVWLEKQVEKISLGTAPTWDIVICDPPTFSSTQDAGTFHVSREWNELAEACARILSRSGVCFFSTNCQSHERGAFERDLRKFFSHVQRVRPPFDFPEMAVRAHAHFFECKNPLV